MKTLIFGASGLIGSTVFRVLSKNTKIKVYGTTNLRNPYAFDSQLTSCLINNIDILKSDASDLLAKIRPDVVINCIGITKHHLAGGDVISAVQVNSIWPIMLSRLCKKNNIRMIQISTDCVFSGVTGFYRESDIPDASDVYGRSKILGEIAGENHVVTLRTSTIGHEYKSRDGLLEWFLSQTDSCKGYRNAIFSGVPTIILAEIIQNYVIPNAALSGLYHVGAKPIDKYTLLHLISEKYNKMIQIVPETIFKINRSLCIDKFSLETGYVPISWTEMINKMHTDYEQKNV